MTVVDAITGTRAGSQRAFRQSFDQTPFRIASSFTAVGALKATVVNANQHVFRISRTSGGTQSLFHLQIRSDGSLRIAEGAGSPTDSTAASTLSADTWYLWAMRQTGGSPATNTVYLYAENGTLIDTLSISDSTDNNITAANNATLAYAGYLQGSDGSWQSDAFGGSMALMSIWASDIGELACDSWAADPLRYVYDNPPDYLQTTSEIGLITESGGVVSDLSDNGFDLTLGGDAAYDDAGGPDVTSFGADITGISPNPMEDGETVTITGTGFEPSGANATVAWGGQSQTVLTSSDTEITFTADVGIGIYGPNGEDDLTVTTSTGIANTISAQMVPNGYNAPDAADRVLYVDIIETPASPDTARISSTPDMAIGSQVVYHTLREDVDGTPAARDITDLIVQIDGSVSLLDDVLLDADFQSGINVRDGEGWSADETITIEASAADEPSLTGADSTSPSFAVNVAGSLALAELVSSGSWTWTVHSGSLPTGMSINSGTGAITGTPTVVGDTTAVVRATGAGGFVAITVNATVFAVDARDDSQGSVVEKTAQNIVKNPIRWILR